MLNNLNFIKVILESLPLGVMCCNFLSVFILSLKNRPRCWAVTYLWTTNTSSPAQVTRRPLFMKSSTKFMEQRSFADVFLETFTSSQKSERASLFCLICWGHTERRRTFHTPIVSVYATPVWDGNKLEQLSENTERGIIWMYVFKLHSAVDCTWMIDEDQMMTGGSAGLFWAGSALRRTL